MFDSGTTRSFGGLATALIGGIGTAGIAFAPPAAAEHTQKYITAYCAQAANYQPSQHCYVQPFVVVKTTRGERLQPTFTNDANGCSDIYIHFLYRPGPGTFLNAEDAVSDGIRLSPGQTAVGPLIDAQNGENRVGIGAMGIEGGCNTGVLQSWGGTLIVDTVAAAPDALQSPARPPDLLPGYPIQPNFPTNR